MNTYKIKHMASCVEGVKIISSFVILLVIIIADVTFVVLYCYPSVVFERAITSEHSYADLDNLPYIKMLMNSTDVNGITTTYDGIHFIAGDAHSTANYINGNHTAYSNATFIRSTFNITIGVQGYKGNRGENGSVYHYIGVNAIKGERGETGLQPLLAYGDTGDKGSSGLVGVKGDTGDMGMYTLGDKGGNGNSGSNGIDGQKGVKGLVGLDGNKGYKGDQGSTGVSLKGNKGTTGDVGYTGLKGAIGGDGDKGFIGATGQKGDTGYTGSDGLSGPVGSTGTSGAEGVKGVQGDTGASGDGGAKGAKGTVGIQGASGSTGSAGSKGSNGLDGATGVTGSKGANGSKGVIGSKGANGDTGDTGNVGATGSKGDNGSAGSSPVGDKGDTGATGANGATGNTGVAGNTGSTGLKGSTGSVGATGDSGTLGVPSAMETVLFFVVNCIYPVINNPVHIVDGSFTDASDTFQAARTGPMLSIAPTATDMNALTTISGYSLNPTGVAISTFAMPQSNSNPGNFAYGIDQSCSASVIPQAEWLTNTGGDAYLVIVGWGVSSASTLTATSDHCIGYCSHTQCTIRYVTATRTGTGTPSTTTVSSLVNFVASTPLLIRLRVTATRVITLIVDGVVRVTLDVSGVTAGTNRNQRRCRVMVYQSDPTVNSAIIYIDYVRYEASNLNRIS
jgi:hypothetical protein